MKYYKLENILGGTKLHDAVGHLIHTLDAKSNTMTMPCGGLGRCGKCMIKVSGALDEPDDVEKNFLSESELNAGMRLACRAVCSGGDIEIYLPEEDTSSEIQLEGILSPFELSPVCSDSTGECYGLAVDIGTTTVAVYLCDLNNGSIIKTGAFQNPQRLYGADVITRIGIIIDNSDNLNMLRKIIVEAINGTIDSFGVDTDKIHAAAVTANTTMLHIFAGYDPRGIANAPFTVSSLFGFDIKANEIGLKINEKASVYLTPCFAAYVGGDIASGMIAAGFDKAEGINLYIDIGTNGEMALGGKDGITLCATAAGPAFEGAHIECGMSGIEGAVSDIEFDENGSIKYTVIGKTKPRGICGSALIDAVALMLDKEILDETGRLDDDLTENDKWYIDLENNIYISGKDIREVQLAKAAVCAGVMTLLHEKKAKLSDVSRVYIAGGFGSHINPINACKIGLLPSEAVNKIEIVGNTAGMGAVLYLLSADARKRINEVSGISKYIELSGDAFFMDEYVERMFFEN